MNDKNKKDDVSLENMTDQTAQAKQPENSTEEEKAADSAFSEAGQGAQTTETTGGPEEAAEKKDAADGPEAGEVPGETTEKAEEVEKKGFFGKKKEKKDPKDIQIEELTDRVRRNMAEFDNYRKRTEKEKSAMFEIGAKDIIERILPVIDNFERGLASMPETLKGSAFANGMEMIYKQLMKNLEEAGVKPIEAAGQPFDPAFHNAVMHVEDEKLGENIVAQELQKGYMYRESVVRHSMVQVAN